MLSKAKSGKCGRMLRLCFSKTHWQGPPPRILTLALSRCHIHTLKPEPSHAHLRTLTHTHALSHSQLACSHSHAHSQCQSRARTFWLPSPLGGPFFGRRLPARWMVASAVRKLDHRHDLQRHASINQNVRYIDDVGCKCSVGRPGRQ